MRQQRRKNAPTAASGFPVYPQLFSDWFVTQISTTEILVESNEPITGAGTSRATMNGIPCISNILGPGNSIQLEWAAPIPINGSFFLPPWDPPFRGLNGQWFAPGQRTLRSTAPSQQVNYVTVVTVTGPTQSTVSLNEPVIILNTPNWTTDAPETVVSAVPGALPNDVVINWSGPVTSYGSFLNIGPGDDSMQTAAGLFLAPYSGLML